MALPSATELDGLPEPVRARVIALVADVLPQMGALPGPLRAVSGFAPGRRARLGAGAIAAALADDDFRTSAATQLRARLPELAELAGAMDDGVVPEPAEPADVASLCWLMRPPGWESTLTTASQHLTPSRAGTGEREAERLRGRLDAAEQALRDVRTEHRAQVSQLRSENTELRRKLGETRAAARAAREDHEVLARDSAEALTTAATALDRSEVVARRLRAQNEGLEAELRRARSRGRSERDEGSIRARLLLDTLLDSATGLRRELALAPVTGAPSDGVEADAAEPGVVGTSAAGALGPGSPVLLDHLLAMPRARLVVDGYNVSKTAWPSSSLEAQRTRLLLGLAPLVARTGVETTVVFDAHTAASRPVVLSPRGVRVVFSPAGVIADDVIRDYVAAEPRGRVVIVVSSDRALTEDVRRQGARVVWSSALVARLAL
jgi:predicted RNA-binding protein with PIN domain